MLTCHGVHLLRTLLQRKGIRTSSARIRNQLSGWMRVTTTMRTNEGALISIRQDTRVDAKEALIARAVDMEPRLHRLQRRSRLPED